MTLQAVLAPPQDDARWLPLSLQAGIVWFAILVLAGCLLLGGVAQRWEQDLHDRLTVQFEAPSTAAQRAAAVDAALARLREDHAIAAADPVPQARLTSLLERALGSSALPDLPLPVVIEVLLTAAARDHRAAVVDRLRNDLPGAVVASVDAGRDPGLRLVRSMQAAGGLALLLLAATFVATVVFATRARLSVQRSALEVLLQLGAEDRAVLAAETRHALRGALLTATFGLVAALATLVSLAALITATPFAALLAPSLTPDSGLLLLLPALLAPLLATLAARLTVLRIVKRYPW